MILVDTNILLDLATKDSEWWEWSLDAIKAAAIEGPLYINAIVYAELSARYESASEVDDFVQIAGVQFVDIPRTAAFLPSVDTALQVEPKPASWQTFSSARTRWHWIFPFCRATFVATEPIFRNCDSSHLN